MRVKVISDIRQLQASAGWPSPRQPPLQSRRRRPVYFGGAYGICPGFTSYRPYPSLCFRDNLVVRIIVFIDEFVPQYQLSK